LDYHDIGHLLCNDAPVQTERDPDTMRGADVAYISYERRPRGPLPRDSYIPEVPELIFEVRSPTDRWSKIMIKVGEYIEAGVKKVCVLDEQTHTAHVYSANDPERVLTADEELTFPDILPGFSVKVGELFE
jgi:Uma2 family endonuclease